MYKNTFLLIILMIIATGSIAQVNVSDSFETPELGPLWARDRMEPGAVIMQSTIVRSGLSAAKVTLHTGDVFEAGKGKSRSTERDELREANNLLSAENKDYQFKFSFFLSDSFPIVPVRLVIAQWKQRCPSGGICSDDSPVLALRYIGGRLFITVQIDTLQTIIYETTEEARNHWLDFTFRVRFSRSANGLVDAWLNKKQIAHYTGITCNNDKKGYTAPSLFYFKMGLYRDVMPQPMIIYIDDYSKKEL